MSDDELERPAALAEAGIMDFAHPEKIRTVLSAAFTTLDHRRVKLTDQSDSTRI